MSTSRDTLQTITATVAERVDRVEASSRHDLELSLLVLEDVADELDGYPIGTTRDRFGQPSDEPTVVLLRRLANAHLRLGVADRRCELDAAADERIAALAAVLVDGSAADAEELGADLLVPVVC